MAEIQQQESKNRKGLHRRKKLSTRVDLTPMVDLGFLLITFFIFTTALSEPSSIAMPLPDEKETTEPPPLAGERKTLSLLLDADNIIRYYEGSNLGSIKRTDYSSGRLREVLLQKIRQVKTDFGKDADPIILIKPLQSSSYGNLVNVLDEMMINGIRKYMLLNAQEAELLQ